MNEEEVIRLDDVWKIFGDRAPEAMQAVKKEGLTKPEGSRDSPAWSASPSVSSASPVAKSSA